MGDVYLAHDLRLHRPVALKVLKPDDRSAEAIDRFVLEARAASALNHPNVAHIYEIGQLRGVVYIAMEYVEGVTLEARLAKGPLPIDDTVDIAVQLADALGEAAAKGIVHRDLKPANIVINQRGVAKILDFGIAKMARMPLSPRSNEPNVVLGTVPYMSPEQARGRDVDPRSDLFALGVILYEMVTGARPFDGDSVLDTFRRITTEAPPPIVREGVPPELVRIIEKLLEKEPSRRYATPEELLEDLSPLNVGWASARPAPVGGGLKPRPTFFIVAALLILAVIGFLLTRDRDAPPSRLTKITSAPGLEDDPALSPDGQSIAYTSDEHGNLDVFVRPVRGGDAVRVTDHAADDAQPAWSPDGTRIAFVSGRGRGGRLSIVLGQALGNFVNAQGGDLFVVSASGGPAMKIVDNAFYPAWSPDGRWIVFQSGRGGRWDLWKIAARPGGGTPMQITNDPEFDYQPSWSHDGKWIVYASGMPGPYRIEIVSADGGTPRAITDGEDRIVLAPVFAADDESIVYSSSRGGSLNLWRLPLSSMKPERMTLGEGDDVHPTISADGKRIGYASVRQTPDLWSFDVASGKSEQVTFDTGREEFPDRSMDGTLVFSSDRGGSDALWLRDASGKLTQLVARSAAGQARWSPDGKRIAYRAIDNGRTSTMVLSLGSADARVIAHDAEAPSWSPDGTRLAFTSWENLQKAQIFVARVDDPRQRRRITNVDLIASYPTWSPDGRFVAFQATRDDGTRHIWLVEVDTGRARPLTSGASEDSHPNWLPTDPDTILFVRNHENLMTVSVATGRITPMTRSNEPNTILDYPSWSRDGKKVDFSIARKRGDLYLLDY